MPGRVSGRRRETPAASARPSIAGSLRTSSSTSAIEAVPVETAPRTDPPSRSRRVMARVSTPCNPTMPRAASQSEKPSRPFGVAFRPSRTITARAAGAADSDASASTP